MRGRSIVPTQRNKLLGAISAVMIGIALVDVTVAGNWDMAVVLGLGLLSQLVLVVTLHAPRPTVSLRGDLFRWLDERSAATGEPLERITDRCVAAYRADLTGTSDDDRRSGT